MEAPAARLYGRLRMKTDVDVVADPRVRDVDPA
jgi:hypothetical protein